MKNKALLKYAEKKRLSLPRNFYCEVCGAQMSLVERGKYIPRLEFSDDIKTEFLYHFAVICPLHSQEIYEKSFPIFLHEIHFFIKNGIENLTRIYQEIVSHSEKSCLDIDIADENFEVKAKKTQRGIDLKITFNSLLY